MRQRFSAQQWAGWFDEFQQSGVTVKEFCKQKDVCQNSFYQWRKKLAIEHSPADSIPKSPFVPVGIAGAASIEIELPGGAIVRVPNDASSLGPVLKVLHDKKALAPFRS